MQNVCCSQVRCFIIALVFLDTASISYHSLDSAVPLTTFVGLDANHTAEGLLSHLVVCEHHTLATKFLKYMVQVMISSLQWLAALDIMKDGHLAGNKFVNATI